MVRQIIFCFCLLLTISGCASRYADFFPYHDDGKQKPHVAFLPMDNTSESCINPTIEKDLYNSIRNQVMYRGDLYFFSEDETGSMIRKAGPDVDFFGKDLSFSNAFCGSEFIVVTELIEHCIVPRSDVKSCYMSHCTLGDSCLSMRLRIRVIDRRCDGPRVILQEIIDVNYAITNNAACNPLEPKGTVYAHKRFVEDVVCRLENVIWSYR